MLFHAYVVWVSESLRLHLLLLIVSVCCFSCGLIPIVLCLGIPPLPVLVVFVGILLPSLPFLSYVCGVYPVLSRFSPSH